MNDTALFINGEWRPGTMGRTRGVANPAHGTLAGAVALADEPDTSDAIAAAARAQPAWGGASVGERGLLLARAAEALEKAVEEAAVSLTLQNGKTLREARAELARAIETLRWHADAAMISAAERGPAVRPEPIGVVGAFTPWNYPAVIIARKVGAAVAAGCTVVLKAAEETPAVVAHLVAAFDEAGAPPGVLNLLFGDPAAIARQVIDSGPVKAISFTGSTAVGKAFARRAARSLKRCVLELGGHAPVVVCADADLAGAVPAIAAYKFECAGQSCNAPSRIYVATPLFDEFVDAFVAAAQSLRVGDGMDAATDMGPMAHRRRVDVMRRLTSDAVARGARVRAGGDGRQDDGFYWMPTVLTDVPGGSSMLIEEPFGPLVAIDSFDTLDEVISKANASPYGLAGYVFTRSLGIADVLTRALDVGSVGINELKGVPPDVGVGGIKDSGYGYEGGRLGIEAFQNLKVVRGGIAEGAR